MAVFWIAVIVYATSPAEWSILPVQLGPSVASTGVHLQGTETEVMVSVDRCSSSGNRGKGDGECRQVFIFRGQRQR